MYDGDNMYVAARCWDQAPPEQWIANELRRDTNQMRNNDHFGVGVRHLLRSAQRLHVLRQRRLAASPIIRWSMKAARTRTGIRCGTCAPGGSRAAGRSRCKIPFKTLRYTSGADQVWGVQFRRAIRHKNEWNYWTPVPRTMAGPQALNRVSSYGTLVGLDLPPAGRNIELKPYALGKMTTDRLTNPPTSNDGTGDIGGDMKYGLTANLTADLTINTDFAQVEIDEQQVNLTRFNLFLPEKREFFLEGRGLFDFARGGAGAGGGPGGTGSTADQPYLFYSRRIGLNRNRVVPIDVGGRLTGKVGKFGVGMMNIQTGDEEVSQSPSTNFTVIRLKRDILRRSTIGAIFTNRNELSVEPAGRQPGLRCRCGARLLPERRHRRLLRRDQHHQRHAATTRATRASSTGCRIATACSAEVLKVGKAFNPEVGFLRRTDFIRGYSSARFSPRPKTVKLVRKYTYQAAYEYYENGAGQVESRQTTGRFNAEFNNSDVFNVEANANYDFLATPFRPNPGVGDPGRRLPLQRHAR